MKNLSPSAQAVCYLRAIEEEVSRDSLAKYFVEEDGRRLAQVLLSIYPGVDRQIAIRSRYFEDKILEFAKKDGIKQIVNIAAGMNTTPHRHSVAPEIEAYAELDLPEMINYKKARIGDLIEKGVIYPVDIDIQYIPVDLLVDDLYWKLKEMKWDWMRPNIFILEGISYYLPLDVLTNVLKGINKISANRSVVIMDYFNYEAAGKDVFEKAMNAIAEVGGELTFTYLSRMEKEKLFKDFKTVSDRLTQDIEKEYCPDSRVLDVVSIITIQK